MTRSASKEDAIVMFRLKEVERGCDHTHIECHRFVVWR